MGTVTLAQFSAQLAALPNAIRAAQRQAVSKGALAITQDIRAQISAATGGSNRLTGVGRRGARVGARYDVKGSVNPTALIRATGPMHLLERGRRGGYEVRPRGRRKRAALRFDGQYAAVTHPGPTGGKQPWARGVTAGTPKAREAYQEAVHEAMRRVFG